jgi:hypothetical protein
VLIDQPSPISPVLASSGSQKSGKKSKSIVPDVVTFAIRMPAVTFSHQWLIRMSPGPGNSKSS